MKRYEIPPGGEGAENVKEALDGTSAEYSLKEQVRRTSESVERLANIFAEAIQVLAAERSTSDADA